MDVTYNKRKFTELLLYVASALKDDPAGGAVKVNKVLFFADFTFARIHGVPITGAEYQKLEHGPAPRALAPVRRELIEAGHATLVDEGSPPYVRQRLMPLRRPDTTLFTPEELALVDEIVGLLKGYSAGQVSELSHEHMGWKHVDFAETIPYDFAILRRPVVTERVQARARELAEQMGRI